MRELIGGPEYMSIHIDLSRAWEHTDDDRTLGVVPGWFQPRTLEVDHDVLEQVVLKHRHVIVVLEDTNLSDENPLSLYARIQAIKQLWFVKLHGNVHVISVPSLSAESWSMEVDRMIRFYLSSYAYIRAVIYGSLGSRACTYVGAHRRSILATRFDDAKPS